MWEIYGERMRNDNKNAMIDLFEKSRKSKKKKVATMRADCLEEGKLSLASLELILKSLQTQHPEQIDTDLLDIQNGSLLGIRVSVNQHQFQSAQVQRSYFTSCTQKKTSNKLITSYMCMPLILNPNNGQRRRTKKIEETHHQRSTCQCG